MHSPLSASSVCAPWPRRSGFLLLLGLVPALATKPAGAVSIGPANGASAIQIGQENINFSGGSQSFSDYGLISVDSASLTGATGISTGFLNVYNPSLGSNGWIVRNLPVQAGNSYPGISTMFDLGLSAPGTPLTNVGLQMDFSPAPTATFAGGGTTNSYTPVQLTYAAEGKYAGAVNTPPVAGNNPNPALVNFAGGPVFSLNWQPGHSSVEQDTNQCGPASVANSLDWLRSTYGAAAPLNPALQNVPGIAGAPANSLVAQLDTAMGRAAGQALNDKPFMNGKLSFIDNANNGLKGKLIIKHWPGAGGGGGVNDTHGNQTVGTTTSTDASAAGGKEIDWIISELQHGEDVEMSWVWPGSGGHWVDLVGGGYIMGIPWVAWVHDAKQGDNTTGTGYLQGGLGFSFVNGQGLLPIWIGSGNSKATLDLAVSESVPEPAAASLLAMLASTAVLSRRRRNRDNSPAAEISPGGTV